MKYYIHQMDPFLIQFTDNFGIRWYALAYILAFVVGYYFMIHLVKHKKTVLKKTKDVSDFLTFVFLGVFLGGRLGYVLFYSPETFFQFSSSFPFWEALSVHKGGMSSHGGFIGVILACCLYGRFFSLPFLGLLDLLALPASLGFFLGRLANFINGELYGRVVESPFRWAVQFPSEMYEWVVRGEKEKLYTLSHAVKALDPHILNWKEIVFEFPLQNRNLIFSAVDRLIKASQSHNEAVLEALSYVLSPRYPSQLYQSFLEGFLVLLVLMFVWKVPRKYGVVVSVFGITYSLMRILGENYRMPDSHIGFELLGLTRGQWLSIGLCLASIGFLLYSLKTSLKKHGGIF